MIPMTPFRPPTRDELMNVFVQMQDDVDLNYACHANPFGISVADVEAEQLKRYGFVPERLHNQSENWFGFPITNHHNLNFTFSPGEITQDQIHRLNEATTQAQADAIIAESIGRR